MGRTKTAQRTKGNQKPSSSSRSATLNGGHSGFIGFSGVNYVPAASQIEDECEIDAEFRVILRKLDKKDAITKSKALQEFLSLCEKEDLDTLKSILPFWPRLYTKLWLDTNELVREDVQHAHHLLVNKTKKHFRPFLKSVMATWLLAMADLNPCVASRAKRSFEESFSIEKRPDALIYCSDEIYKCLADNILMQAKILENNLQEEEGNQFCRIICCSLKALGMFLDISKPSLSTETNENINIILESKKFWTYSKHKNTLIRSAWFAFLPYLIEYSNMENEYLPVLSKSIFSSINCTESNVLPHVWRSMLLLCAKSQTCWKHCGKPEAACSNILAVLRDGGRGHAIELFPLLTPLLRVMPKDIANSSFYTNILRAMSSSLQKNEILAYREETKIIISTMFQCISFLDKQGVFTNEQWRNIVTHQIFGHITSSWNENQRLKDSCLYREIASILADWSLLEKNNDRLVYFWDLFLAECNLLIENEKKCEIETMEMIFEDFAGCRRKTGKKIVEFSLSSDHKSVTVPQHFIEHVSTNISQLVKLAHQKACYDLFYCLITRFPSPEAFSAILNKPVKNVHLAFVEDIVVKQLSNFRIPVKYSTKIFFHFYNNLCEVEKHNILFGFKDITTEALTVIVHTLSNLTSTDSTAASWLKSEELGRRVVKEVQEVFSNADAHEFLPTTQMENCELHDKISKKAENDERNSMSLTKVVFGINKTSDAIFSTNYLNQMVKVIRELLLTNLDEDRQIYYWNKVYVSVNLLESLVSNYICWSLPETSEVFCVLLRYFQVCCTESPQVDNARYDVTPYDLLSVFIHTSFESCATYQLKCGLTEDTFIRRFVCHIKASLFNTATSFNAVSDTSKLVCQYFRALSQKCDRADCDILLDQILLHEIFHKYILSVAEWDILEEALLKEYVTTSICDQNIIFCDFPSAKTSLQWERFDPTYPKICLFMTDVLLTLSERLDTEDDSATISLGECSDLCVRLLHADSYMNEIFSTYRKTYKINVSPDEEYGACTLRKKVGELMQLVDDENKRQMITHFWNRCKPGEYLWPISLQKCPKLWLPVEVDIMKLIQESPIDLVCDTTVLQIFGKFLTNEQSAKMLSDTIILLKASHHDFIPVSVLIKMSCQLLYLESSYSKLLIEDIFVLLQENKKSQEYGGFTRYEEMSRSEIMFKICLTRLLSTVIARHPGHLSRENWEFTLYHLCSIVASLYETAITKRDNYEMAMLIGAAGILSHMFFRVMSFNSEMLVVFTDNLLEEWNVCYLQFITSDLIGLLINVAAFYCMDSSCHMLYEICSCLSMSLLNLPVNSLLKMDMSKILDPSDQDKLEIIEKAKSCFAYTEPLMSSSHVSLQLVSHFWMEKIQRHTGRLWCNENIPLTYTDIPQLAAICIKIIAEAEIKIEKFLNERTIEEQALQLRLVPHTKEFACWMKYLLAFNLLFSFCKFSTETSRQQFVTYFAKKDHLHLLLTNLLFILLPMTPTNGCGSKIVEYYFNKDFNYHHEIDEKTLPLLASIAYKSGLTMMPADCRYWIMKLEKSQQQSITNLTRVYVSPILIRNEFKLLNEENDKFDNMKVKTKEKAREVVATYAIDDTNIDLVLYVSPKHPLSPVTFDHSKTGVATANWRALNKMLVYRNTTLLTCLLFWKKNVDQKISGVEVCFICYSVLQGSVNQIPRLGCRICKNKFHSACLYKWFGTSVNTSCPICRTPF